LPGAVRLLKQGMLTKLSKGGFTPNWNRRAFALLGSSLYYAKDKTTLLNQPKIFAQVVGCECVSWADDVTNRNNTLAIKLPSEDTGDSPEILVIAADTARDKFAWIEAITRGSRMPPCPPEWVHDILCDGDHANHPLDEGPPPTRGHSSASRRTGASDRDLANSRTGTEGSLHGGSRRIGASDRDVTHSRSATEDSTHGGHRHADRDERTGHGGQRLSGWDQLRDERRRRHHERDTGRQSRQTPAAASVRHNELPWYALEKWLPFVENV